jgi:endonuclease/exonuclease/phosphatase (EEP) superfamily protein YafD
MLETVLGALTALVAAVTLLPFVPIPHGAVRVCDFPRQQAALLAAVLLVVTVAAVGATGLGLALGAVLLVTLAVQLVYILRFTPVWRVQSVVARDGEADDRNTFSVLSSNVKMSNRDYGRTIALVRERRPDIAVFMETDAAWFEALSVLQDEYPFVVDRAQDNAYGMVLISRLRLEEVEVRCLLTDGVPSISTAVRLADGRRFRLHAVHPEPPVPTSDSVGRDAELALVARLVKEDRLPAVVTGDLNDVAWSPTTRRFQRLSGMLDPRVGRGFYNSFDARYWFLRWPLDHLFHDAEFRLVGMERLPYTGSDHFPMLFRLALTSRPAAETEPDAPDATDKEEADGLIAEAAENRHREPIGTDWEK